MATGPFTKRSGPHGEDPKATAGGDSAELLKPRGVPIPANAGTWTDPGAPPPGEGSGGYATPAKSDQIENYAATVGLPEADTPEEQPHNFLELVREAEQQSGQFMSQMNRKAWAQSMRAVHNEHFAGSKYTTADWRNRSKIFRPKTRSAMRKDMAAVMSSLFNNMDAINCVPGNEADPQQRGAASVMEELINYRTDVTSGKAAIPWFTTVMGARQDALTTAICLSKQSWKLDLRKETEQVMQPDPVTGIPAPVTRDVYRPEVDRPDCQLIPPENFIIDMSADWTNPAQSASYIMIKWPMQIGEIRVKQKSPVSPWMDVDETILLAAAAEVTSDSAAIRNARESGVDRFNKSTVGKTFRIIWVYEVFMRVDGEDWTFLSIGDKAYLTEPRLTREVYPEQSGDRPLVMGYGTIEAHRIFPMSSVESWQMMQIEVNDLINLSLDAIKQNVMPVSKVRRGRQIDLDQVKKRASGSSIMVSQPDDVTWERVPDIPQSVPMFMRDLELEMDDLAGQFNGQSAEHNNALSRTLGGLKLVSGAANAVQEMDIRVWIETWVNPALSQLVRLEQWYEHDPIVLGLCGDRAELFEKHGINSITDELLEQNVTIRVNAGLGAGDPQTRLSRFQAAAGIVVPILAQSPKFISGELQIDEMAIMEEVFGAAGYRDFGKRFIKKGQAKQDPLMDLKAKEIMAKITRDDRQGKASLLTGLAAVAKVALGHREAEDQQTNALLDYQAQAQDMGHQHGMDHNQHKLDQRSADLQERSHTLNETDKGHAHGLQIAQHRDDNQHRTEDRKVNQAKIASSGGGSTKPASGGGASAAPAAPPPAPSPEPPAPEQQMAPQSQPQPQQAAPVPIRYNFIRDPRTGRISGAVPVYAETPRRPPPDEADQVPFPPPMAGPPGGAMPAAL